MWMGTQRTGEEDETRSCQRQLRWRSQDEMSCERREGSRDGLWARPTRRKSEEVGPERKEWIERCRNTPLVGGCYQEGAWGADRSPQLAAYVMVRLVPRSIARTLDHDTVTDPLQKVETWFLWVDGANDWREAGRQQVSPV
jgi:hypothetical protein